MSIHGKNNKVRQMIEKLIDKNVDRSFAVCDLNDIVRKYESWKLAMPRIKPFYVHSLRRNIAMSMQGENDKINNMIEKLIDKNVDRSFAVCDLNDIVRKYESWKLAMPRIKPFYAVKCNNYPCVLQLLADLGAGFDCATKNEIEAVMKMKCSANNIIFSNPIKEINHIKYAGSVGVKMTTFDSLCELEKCKKYYPGAKLFIRIKTYSANFSSFESKFGCDPYSEAPILLEAAKSLGLDVIGVAFHVGTICNDGPIYYNAIKLARYVFDVAWQLGFDFDTLNIGGGMVAYSETTIFEVGKVLKNALDEYFPNENVKFIAEPGRYFVRSSVTLATKVITFRPKRLDCKENELHYLYYVDNGITGMFAVITHGFSSPPPLAWKQTTPLYPCTVFGQTMAPPDLITPHAMLPKLEVGDWILYENMGAYAHCLESQFHLYEPTPVYFISRSISTYSIQGKPQEE